MFAAQQVIDLVGFLRSLSFVGSEFDGAVATALEQNLRYARHLMPPPLIAAEALCLLTVENVDETRSFDAVGELLLQRALWIRTMLFSVTADVESAYRSLCANLDTAARAHGLSAHSRAALDIVRDALFLRAVSVRDLTLLWFRHGSSFTDMRVAIERAEMSDVLLFATANTLVCGSGSRDV